MKWQRALSDGSRLTQFYFLGMGKYTAKYLICQEKSPFVGYSYFLMKFGFVLYLFHVKHFLYFHCKNNMMHFIFCCFESCIYNHNNFVRKFYFRELPDGQVLGCRIFANLHPNTFHRLFFQLQTQRYQPVINFSSGKIQGLM